MGYIWKHSPFDMSTYPCQKVLLYAWMSAKTPLSMSESPG